MLQAALLVMLAQPPGAQPAPPAELTPASGETAPAATSDAVAPSIPAASAPTPRPEGPAQASAPVLTATPEKPAYERPPAVGKTDVTAFNARTGDESEISQSRHKIGKGLTFTSKDRRFSLQVRARLQLRYDVEHYNALDAEGQAKDTMQSLQIRRARLQLQGNVFSPYVRYVFQFGFSPRDMQNDLPQDPGALRRSPLRDARVEFDRLRDFTVWMGQFKVPFSRQRIISSSNMNMVDRSLVNAEFNLDRDIGFQAMSKDLGGLGNRLAYYVGVFMGEGRNAFDLKDTGMLFVGRLELMPFGKFDDYTEGDVARSKKPGLSIAGAYAFQDRAHAAKGSIGDFPADGGTTDFHHINTDLLFKWRGLSLQTALHLRKGFNRKSGGAVDETGAAIPTVPTRQGLGWYGQLGYVVPKIPLEIVGRYGLVRNTHGALSSLKDQDEAGGGLNWYFVGHDLKLQLDYFRVWDQGMGTTTAERARNGTDRVRLQFQVYF
jgi:phosphate-selective porin OprO/OprP